MNQFTLHYTTATTTASIPVIIGDINYEDEVQKIYDIYGIPILNRNIEEDKHNLRLFISYRGFNKIKQERLILHIMVPLRE